MPNVTIYHNPRCSKSRQALQLLRDQHIEPEIIDYLKTPPAADTLKHILKLLHLKPRELMRTKEAIYRENNIGSDSLSEEQLIGMMVKHPILIERPIVIHGNKAVIGRPPEKVLEIL
ncbi:arsenate reductase (glutaredoxin) [Candidiatus Paracoxiella cheracis]|uniref:arsenate reductase (glutaredoxin) n=1 Tax=Candidiatus Paracoxiella cheracis TaxID=3405120 RepID=UPI003BF551BC